MEKKGRKITRGGNEKDMIFAQNIWSNITKQHVEIIYGTAAKYLICIIGKNKWKIRTNNI